MTQELLPTDPPPTDSQPADLAASELLRNALQVLLRSFGALSPERTPCGQPLTLSHAHALMALYENGDLRQVDVARVLGLSTSATSRLVDQLEQRGWAMRRSDAADARASRVELTPAGQKVAERTQLASRERFAAILAALAPASHGRILASLRELSVAMASIRGPAIEDYPAATEPRPKKVSE